MDAHELRRVLEIQRDLYLKPGDKILVVLVESLAHAPITNVLQDYDFDIALIPMVERPGQDYEVDEKLLDGKTVGWLITNISVSHSPATKRMLDKGMFLISNPGITPDWLAILNPANREPCQKNAKAILNAIGGDIGGKFHIIANDGTDLWLKVPNKNWHIEAGGREGIGTNGTYGELTTAPYWAEGTLVLRPGDFLTNPINRVNEKIVLTIHTNRVVEIKGGSQFETLTKMLEEPNDPKAFQLGEFAFGLNPGKPEKLYRSVVAEKRLGGIHIAIGTNSICLKEDCPEISKFKYGRYTAGVHIDCIKFGASVFFEPEAPTRTILEKGILMI
ncbi:aminopeptidase [Patescibacteria group bacterium]|nr:aminopeptidase [Patescibacteria group bacterium]